MNENVPLLDEECSERVVSRVHIENCHYVIGGCFCCLGFVLFPVLHCDIVLAFICYLPVYIIFFCCLPCLLPFILKQEPSKDIPFGIKFFSYFAKVNVGWMPKLLMNGWEPIVESMGYINQSDRNIKYSKKTLEYMSEKFKGEKFEVDLYFYEPLNPIQKIREGKNDQTIILYFHGGGCIIGHPFAFNTFFKRLVGKGRRFTLVAPRYHLAPNFKMDSIVREGVHILKYLVKQYSIDLDLPPQMIIAGDSCGAKLSQLIANYVRDDGYRIIPKKNLHVISFYPPVALPKQFNNEVFESRVKYGEKGYVFSIKGYEDYAFPIAEKFDKVNGKYNEFNFFNEEHLKDLCSHFFITAEYCIFRSEAKHYFEKLKEVQDKEEIDFDSEYHMTEREVHGFTAQRIVTVRGKESLEEVVDLVIDNIEKKFRVIEEDEEIEIK